MAAISKETVVGIVGAGAMGSGIAQVAAVAGHPVLLWDSREGAANQAKEKLGQSLAKLVDKGMIDTGVKEAVYNRVQTCDSLDAFANAGLVVEAIVEDAAAKATLFQQLESIVAPETILVSNTSSLSITKLGAALQRPERFAGWHFFNPAPVMPLVEVVKGLATDPAVVGTLMETARAWAKTPVEVVNAPGFIVNRGARPFYSEPLRFVEDGGTNVETADALFRAQGFRMGPFELIDLVGLDVNLSASRSMWEAYRHEPRYAPALLVEELVDAGRLGRKSGQGFYSYPLPENQHSGLQLIPDSNLPTPEEIIFYGNVGPAAGLFTLCREKGLNVDRGQGDGWIFVDGVKLALTDGRMATELGPDWVTLDLALDWSAVTTVAVSESFEANLTPVVALFNALGKRVATLSDRPGMLGARTICMLVNEACDTVQRGVASREDVDTAMQKGLNFPGGPFQWADSLGAAYVLKLLENMHEATKDPRFRPSALLRSMAHRTP